MFDIRRKLRAARKFLSPKRARSVRLAPRIVIVAEMSIPACRHYRVSHKVDSLARLGCSVVAVNWWHAEACREAIQLADAVIFYRVGLQPMTVELFDAAARLGLPTFFEADDVIFDEEIFSRLASFRASTLEQQQHLLQGVRYYRAALEKCDHAIASTAPLAAHMNEVNGGQAFVVENGLNEHMLTLSERLRVALSKRLRAALTRRVDKVVIGYGSGTATHDIDFAEAAAALLRILEKYPNAELVVQGPLQLPPMFAPFLDRVVRLPLMAIDGYLRSLATWDISLACLEDTLLNRAKSAVKFQEAALFGIPSVCSAVGPYLDVVDHGRTGFLAQSEQEWFDALSALVESKTLRDQIGGNASAAVQDRFNPERIARVQVKPLVDLIRTR